MNRYSTRVYCLLIWTILCISGKGLALAEECIPAEQILAEVQEVAQRGLRDRALVLLKSAHQCALQQQDKVLATQALLQISLFYQGLGRIEDEGAESLLDALGTAKGTHLEAIVEFELLLNSSSISLDKNRFPESLASLFKAEQNLSKIEDVSIRMQAESKALTLKANLFKRFMDQSLEILKNKSLQELDTGGMLFLLSVIRNVSPYELYANPDTPQIDFVVEFALALSTLREWDQPIFEAWVRTLERAEEVDSQIGGRVGILNVAIDRSQKGDVYALWGDINKAIEIKKGVLPVFLDLNSFNDIVAVLSSLRDLHLELENQVSFAKALEFSTELIEQLEKQTPAMTSRTLGTFLHNYEKHYHRHLDLLFREWLFQKFYSKNTRNAEQGLEKLVLHHDRMLYRTLRRDFGVYRELGDQFEGNSELRRVWESEIQKIKILESDWQAAYRAGKDRSDYIIQEGEKPEAIETAQSLIITPKGFEIDSPYAKLLLSKMELVEVLENFKRRVVGSSDAVYELPTSLNEVRRGMNKDEAIIVYLGKLPKFGVIITSSGIQLRELNDLKLKENTVVGLRDLLKQLQHEINRKSPEAERILKQIATAIWHPLDKLPKHLTIVLSHHFQGIPFESLPMENGEPVITRHTIRYAFGLSNSLGEHVQQQTPPRRVLVVGAESFPNSDFGPLPESAKEVKELRNYFALKGIVVEPFEELPVEGKPIFATKDEFDVMHISTHGDPDKYASIYDALLFPGDRVTGFDIAISPLRTQLLVLSACRLFEPRKLNDLIASGESPDLVSPISGLTATSLARISPQVVSTLWEVDSVATKIFMQRFYDALYKEREPSVALAVTKRDFIEPKQLEKWMKSKGLTIGPEILNFKKPYYWAPFVLAIRKD